MRAISLLLFIVCLFSCSPAEAQGSRKAGRRYAKSVRFHEAKRVEKSIKKMEQSIRKSPTSPDGYSQLGQWYFEAHKFSEAAEVFKRGTLHCKNGGIQFAKPYARSLLYAGQPDNAMRVINNYGNGKDTAGWDKMRVQAVFVKQALAQPVARWPVRLSNRVNTPDPEMYPCMAVDTEMLYFTRRVNDMDDDLFKVQRDTCDEWLRPDNMGVPPNSPDQECAQFISADGHYLFFTRCENRSENGWAEGGCDLFMAYRVANDSDWTIAQPFGATINTPFYEGMPSLSPDNRLLFFVSDRPGGYGGFDIWYSIFQDGLWQLPVNAGPEINSKGNETAPYINPDNRTIYFTSDGWPGMGGSDIFVSHRIDDTTWGRCINLGYPINTANDEKSECVTLDGKTLFMASDRNGPAGNYDIFEAPLPGYLQPIPVSYLKGYVYDSLTNERLNFAAITISNAVNGVPIYQFHSNRGDGSYLITLHQGNTYAISTERMSYTSVYDTLVLDKQYLKPLEHNIAMVPTGYLRPISDTLIATLHFEVNHIELSDSDKAVIYRAVLPWLEEKGIVVYVNAYTDNTGTPMINEELSYKRAAIVAKEIASLGIDEASMQSKGWGEANMVAPNDTEDGQRKNRRVEVIVKR